MTILNIPLGLFFIAAQFVVSALRPNFSLLVLGLFVCVAPFTGANVVNGCVLAWFIGDVCAHWLKKLPTTDTPDPQRLRFAVLGLIILVTIFILGLLKSARNDLDGSVLSALYRYGGFTQTLRYVVFAHDRLLKGLLLIVGYVLSALLVIRLSRREPLDSLRQLRAGIVCGVLVNAVFLVGQLTNLSPIFSQNRSAFWQYTGRYPAAFSDPNALGVAGVLLIVLLCIGTHAAKTRWNYVTAALVGILEVWSGSRTFWLGIVLLGVVYGAAKANTSTVLLSRFGRSLVLAVLLIITCGEPHINSTLQSTFATPSTKRLLRSINWQEASSMYQSRFVFSKIAVETWQRSPLLGVGLNGFFDFQQQSAKSLGIELDDWRDNANNYYLQILTEEGLLGVVLLLLSLYCLTVSVRPGVATLSNEVEIERNKLSLGSARSLGVLCLLLCSGPHFYFDEVRQLAAILLGIGVASGTVTVDKLSTLRIIRGFALVVAIMYVALLFSRPLRSQASGVYGVEQGKEGKYVWTVDAAKISLCPGDQERASVAIKTLKPDISQKPQFVELQLLSDGVADDRKAVVLQDADWHTVHFHRDASRRGSRLEVMLTVSPLWSPDASGHGGDNRFLGVMLEWPRNVCEVAPDGND